MNNDNNIQVPAVAPETETDEMKSRREAITKLGKYAAYVAPFTVMAFSAKAAGISGTGGKPGSAAARR